MAVRSSVLGIDTDEVHVAALGTKGIYIKLHDGSYSEGLNLQILTMHLTSKSSGLYKLSNLEVKLTMAALKLQTTDVVIVGAGLSGLRAATEIADSGLSYVLLEAMDHVGGKTLSLPTNNSTGLIEMGAAWINDSNQSEMYSLARDFDFNLVIQRCEGNSLVESRSGEIASVPFGAPGLVRSHIDKI